MNNREQARRSLQANLVVSSLTNILASINLGGISEVVVVSFRKLLLSCFLDFILHLCNLFLVELNVRGLKSWCLNKDKISIVNEPSQ